MSLALVRPHSGCHCASPASPTNQPSGEVRSDTCGHVGSCWTMLNQSNPGGTLSKSLRRFYLFMDSIILLTASCRRSMRARRMNTD
jgi:hypothetical protein